MDTNRNFDIRYRLKYALDRYGWTIYKLAGSEDNALRSRLQKQIHGNTAISADTLELFLDTFSDLSAEWLMRGVGDFTSPAAKGAHLDTTITQHIHTDGGPAAVTASGSASASPSCSGASSSPSSCSGDSFAAVPSPSCSGDSFAAVPSSAPADSAAYDPTSDPCYISEVEYMRSHYDRMSMLLAERDKQITLLMENNSLLKSLLASMQAPSRK